MPRKVTARPNELQAWEQLKVWKHVVRMKQNYGCIDIESIASLNRAYTVYRTIKIEQELQR